MSSSDTPTVIKKYANRRLYNTGSSTYVTLEDLAEMVKDGEEFVVQDAKSGEDLTRMVLAQIIFDQEAKEGQSLLPINFLRQLISFYGDSVQAVVPSYLEHTMGAFAREQEKMKEQMATMFGQHSVAGIEQMEAMARQNMELFQKTMQMFSPFASEMMGGGMSGADARKAGSQASGESELTELKDELARLKDKLDKLG